MVKTRKIPQRLCLGCNESKPKKELWRIVRTPEGQVMFDPSGKKSGRGAYLCPDATCLEKGIKTKRLERTLETNISPEIWAKLRDSLANG